MWLPWLAALPRNFRYVMPDLPGFGHSKAAVKPDMGFLEVYAAVIERCRAELNADKIMLVGFSMGAYACLYYLTHGGSRHVDSYLHIDHPLYSRNQPNWSGGLSNSLLETMDHVVTLSERYSNAGALDYQELPWELSFAYRRTLAELSRQSYSFPRLGRGIARLYDIPVLKDVISNRIGWPWAMDCIKSYSTGRYDFRQSIKDVSTPITILAGRKNPLFDEGWVDDFMSRVPNANLKSFDRAAHDLMLRQPLKFIYQLRKFLN